MSLRKSPTITEARLEANRRNAKKSTGPRTATGKARSKMNGLRYGGRSPEYLGMFAALGDAAPGAILRVGEACLTPAQRMHPMYVRLVEMFTQVEADMVEHEPGSGTGTAEIFRELRAKPECGLESVKPQ